MNTSCNPLEKIRLQFDHFAAVAAMPGGKDHMRELSKEKPLLRQMAKSVLIKTHDIQPAAFNRIITAPYARAGHDVIGFGYHTVALRTGRSVLKAYRHTASLSEAEQEMVKKQLEVKQNLLLEHMEQYVVPQRFSIEESPLNPSRSMVIAHQEHIAATGSVDFRSHDKHLATAPFTEDAEAMYHWANALPDVVGTDNVVATDNGLKIIDTIPLLGSDPDDDRAFGIALDILELRSDSLKIDS